MPTIFFHATLIFHFHAPRYNAPSAYRRFYEFPPEKTGNYASVFFFTLIATLLHCPTDPLFQHSFRLSLEKTCWRISAEELCICHVPQRRRTRIPVFARLCYRQIGHAFQQKRYLSKEKSPFHPFFIDNFFIINLPGFIDTRDRCCLPRRAL